MNAHQTVHQFCLEKAATEPVERRIEIIQALAELAATPAEQTALQRHADHLSARASQLRSLEREHSQLLLNLRVLNTY
jgi:hypothetical protein